MGLAISHGCISVPYSFFNRWRRNIAKSCLWTYSIKGNDIIESIDFNWNSLSQCSCEISKGLWKKRPDDILLILYLHSDCEGFIYHKHLKELIKVLRGHYNDFIEYINKINPGMHFEIRRMGEYYLSFLGALERAYKRKQKIHFR